MTHSCLAGYYSSTQTWSYPRGRCPHSVPVTAPAAAGRAVCRPVQYVNSARLCQRTGEVRRGPPARARAGAERLTIRARSPPSNSVFLARPLLQLFTTFQVERAPTWPPQLSLVSLMYPAASRWTRLSSNECHRCASAGLGMISGSVQAGVVLLSAVLRTLGLT